jgi:hypothetical protein
MQRVLILILALCLMGATCGVPLPYPIEPSDTSQCAAACHNLERLRCPEAQPLEDGTTCEVFCERTQEAGHPLNPTCVSQILFCDQIQECTNAD